MGAISSASSQKKTVPGHGYYSKIQTFIDEHFHVGGLVIEYIKKSCTEADSLCDFGSLEWVGPELKMVPLQYPNYTDLSKFHYEPLKHTPTLLMVKLGKLMTFNHEFKLRSC